MVLLRSKTKTRDPKYLEEIDREKRQATRRNTFVSLAPDEHKSRISTDPTPFRSSYAYCSIRWVRCCWNSSTRQAKSQHWAYKNAPMERERHQWRYTPIITEEEERRRGKPRLPQAVLDREGTHQSPFRLICWSHCRGPMFPLGRRCGSSSPTLTCQEGSLGLG